MGQSDQLMMEAWNTVYKDDRTKVLEHPRLGSKMIVHRLVYPDRTALQTDKALFEQRKSHPSNLVRVQSILAQHNSLPCSQSCRLQVTLDHTDYTLKEVITLHQQKGLYVLHEALKGFKFLYRTFGGVIITRAMIALNQLEEVKVWFNQTFVRNRPEPCFKHISEADMVQSIFKAVAASTIDQEFSREFLHYFAGFTKGNTTFSTAINAIEEYAMRATQAYPSYQLSTITRMGHPTTTENSMSFESRDQLTTRENGLGPVNLQQRFESFQIRGLHY